MRSFLLLLLTLGCSTAPPDAYSDEAPEISRTDSAVRELRQLGPIAIGAAASTYRSYDQLTAKEQRELDSLASVIRSQGGVACY